MIRADERRRNMSAIQLVHSPPAIRVLSQVLAAALLVALLAIFVLPWQQNVSGSGRVVAFDPYDRIQTIAAPLSGRVREAWVIEGSRVEAGDRILEIVDNDPSLVDRLETQRAALEVQLEAAREKVALYDKQVEALESAREMAMESARLQVEVASAASQSTVHALEAARAFLRQAELNSERQRELYAEGLASEYEWEVAERVRAEAQARVEQSTQAQKGAQNDESAQRAKLGQVDTEAQSRVESAGAGRQAAAVEVAATEERIASFASRISQQSTQLITAPRTGTIFRMYAAPGAELVKGGDPLVSFIPDTESRAVELWVDGNNVPLIDKDRRVRLQFEGWPTVQFSGWPSVAIGTFGGRVALVDPSADAEGRFRLLVVPDVDDDPWPATMYLRQGVRANGFVLLDQVSLAYELWRQANDFPPTVAMDRSPDAKSADTKEPNS